MQKSTQEKNVKDSTTATTTNGKAEATQAQANNADLLAKIEALQAENAKLQEAEEKRKEAEKQSRLKEQLSGALKTAETRIRESMLKDDGKRTTARIAAGLIAARPGQISDKGNHIQLGSIQGSHVQDGILGMQVAFLIRQGLFNQKFTEEMKSDKLFNYDLKLQQGEALQEKGLLPNPLKALGIDES